MPYRRLIPLRPILSLMIALALLAAGPAGGAAIAQSSGISRTVELYPWTGLPMAPEPSVDVEANEALLRVVFTNGSGSDIAMSEVDLVVTLPATPASLALAGTSGGVAKVSLASSSDPAIADAAAAFTLAYSDAESTRPPENASACTATPDFSETQTDSKNGTYATQRDSAVHHVCLDGQTGYTWPAGANLIVDIVLNAPGILFGVTDAEAGVLSGLSEANTLFLVANEAGGLTPGYVADAPNSQSEGALAARIGQPVGSVQDWSAGATTTARGATVPPEFLLPTFKAGDQQIAWPGLEINGGTALEATPLHLPDLGTDADNLTVILAGEYDVSDGTIPAGGLLISFTPAGQSTPDVFLVSRTTGTDLQSVPDFAMIRSQNTDIPWNGLATGQWAQPFVLTLVAKAGSVPDLYWNGTWLANDAAPGDRLHIAQSLTEGALFGDDGGFDFSPPIRLGSVLVTSVDLDISDLNTLVQAAAARVGATVTLPIKPSILPELRNADGEVLASLDEGAETVIPISVASGENLDLVVTVTTPDGTPITDIEAPLAYADDENFDAAFFVYEAATGYRTINWSDPTPTYDPDGTNVYALPIYIEAGETDTAYVHRRDYVFQVTVEPPANQAPEFTLSPSEGNLWITAGTSNATVLFTYEATDAESDDTTLTFSLAGTDGSSGAFSIGSSSGELILADGSVADANGDGVYSLQIQVSDGEASTSSDLSVRRLAVDQAETDVFSSGSTGFFYLAGVSELSPYIGGGGDPILADDEPFRRVKDLSGNDHDGVSDSLESHRPVLDVDHGLPAFSFRGGPDFLDVTGLQEIDETSLTAIIVLEPISTSDEQYLVDIETGRTVLAYTWRPLSSGDAQKQPVAYYDGAWVRGGDPLAWNVSTNIGKRMILTYRLGYEDDGALRGAIYLNDDLNNPLVTGSYEPDPIDGTIRIGKRFSGDNYPYNGLIYSVLLVDRALTTEEIVELVTIAKERYAIE